MGRVFIRIALTIVGVVAMAGLVLLFVLYSENNRRIVIAHKMMDSTGELQVGKSSLAEVIAYARKYNAEATGSWHENPCTETDCLVIADAHKNDFAERHPKLGLLGIRISRRYWNFDTLMWVKDGKLDGVEQWFWFSTPTTNTSVITDTSRPTSRLCRNPYFRLHRTFAAYEDAKHFAIWVDSAATPEKEMLRLNLDCAASTPGCRNVADMAPVAWAKYQSDRARISSSSWEEAAQDADCR